MTSTPIRISGELRARLAALRLKGTEAQQVRTVLALGLYMAEEIQRRAMVPKEVGS